MVTRNASIIKEIINNSYAFQSWESTCQDYTSKYEVKNDKEDILVEKEELIKKKVVKNKEIIREEKKHEN